MSMELNKESVEQAGANVGHGHVFPRADGVKMRCGGPGLCSECTADASRARAALAQPSPAQAEQHWPKLEKPAQVGAIRFRAGLSSRLVVEAAQRLYEFESTPEKEAERIERLQAFREQCFEPLGAEFSKVLSENLIELSSEAKPEQAEAERPEMSPERAAYFMRRFKSEEKLLGPNEQAAVDYVLSLLALARVAEMEKELAMARDAAAKGDAARHAAGGMEMEIQELKAKLAELEKQEPLLHINPLVVDELLGRAKRSPGGLTWSKGRCGSWTLPLYAAPVAQAQQLNDLDKQCRDDVARALGLRPNQERGFAWSYLLASIKSCVKASGDSAQAQHSVPDGAADLCRFLAKLYCELDGLRYSTAKLPAEQIADALIFKWPVLQGARNQLNIKRISEQPYDESKLHSAIAAMLAAAPGKEVGHE